MLNIICCCKGHVSIECNDGLLDVTEFPKTNLVKLRLEVLLVEKHVIIVVCSILESNQNFSLIM